MKRTVSISLLLTLIACGPIYIGGDPVNEAARQERERVVRARNAALEEQAQQELAQEELRRQLEAEEQRIAAREQSRRFAQLQDAVRPKAVEFCNHLVPLGMQDSCAQEVGYAFAKGELVDFIDIRIMPTMLRAMNDCLVERFAPQTELFARCIKSRCQQLGDEATRANAGVAICLPDPIELFRQTPVPE